jgi:hypothetical protein
MLESVAFLYEATQEFETSLLYRFNNDDYDDQKNLKVDACNELIRFLNETFRLSLLPVADNYNIDYFCNYLKSVKVPLTSMYLCIYFDRQDNFVGQDRVIKRVVDLTKLKIDQHEFDKKI